MGIWLSIGRFLATYLVPCFTALGTILLALGAELGIWKQERLFGVSLLSILGGLFLVLSTLISTYRERKHKERQQEHQHLVEQEKRLGNAGRMLLHSIAEDLDLVNEGARLTLYRRCEGGFQKLARYSHNEEFNSSGRMLQPRAQGGISRAWEKGTWSVRDLPECRVEWDRYHVDEFDVDESIPPQMKMQSRSYLATRISTTANGVPAPVAVLVVESIRPREITTRMQEKLTDSREFVLLGRYCSVRADTHSQAS